MKPGTTQALAEPRISGTTPKLAAQPTLATWVDRVLNALFSKVRNDTYIH